MEIAKYHQTPLYLLVVEDSLDDYALITHELSRLSQPFHVQRVETKAELCTALQENRWDMIISDHNLPQLHSATVLQILRQYAPATPLLLVSGQLEADAGSSILHLTLEGADDYISKDHLARLVPSINRSLRVQQALTQQQVAQAALKHSLQQLQTLVAAAPLGIIGCDQYGQIQLWNERASDMLGHSAEKMLGVNIRNIPTNDPRFLLLNRLDALYQELDTDNPSNHITAMIERPDGNLLDIEIHTALLRNIHTEKLSSTEQESGKNGMVAIIQDVTDLHITRAAHQESETRFSALSGNLPGVVLQMLFRDDPQQHERKLLITQMSDGAWQLFNRSPRDFHTQPELFMQLLDQEDRNSLLYELGQRSKYHEVIRWEGKIHLPASTTGEKPNVRWIYLSASPRHLDQHKPSAYSQWDGIIMDVSTQKQLDVQIRESQEELRALTANMEKVKEEERAYVAREVHDDIGGTLSKLKADIALLKKALQPSNSVLDRAAVLVRLEDMDHLLDYSVEGTRRIARALRPGILDYGVIPALEWQAGDFSDRTGIKTQFICNQEEVPLDDEQSTAVFRIVQESLTNILKYAHATEVFIEVFVGSADINIEVRDNGLGFIVNHVDKSQSFGIRGMRERALMLGGWLDISSSQSVTDKENSQSGTTVMLSIPLERRIERRKRPRAEIATE